ncbi:MAG: cache domain-containing protein [Thermodesulfobacteriota bacterium]|nr:cache domain-containing protein [Thermodesulfobacteriota bacterium]
MFSSIRSKLIAILIILGVIPLLVVGYLSYRSASDALLSQTKEQLGNLADKTAQQIDNFFEVAEKDIDLLSNFPFIQLSFLQFEFGQRLDTVKRLIEDYEKKNKYFKRIHLVNLQGKSILTVPESRKDTLADFKSTDWFNSTLNKGICLSGIIKEDSFSSSAIMLAKLIYDFEDKTKPVGILAFEIKLSSFTSFVASLKIGTQGYAFLLDEHGYMIYHPDQSLRLKRTFIESGDAKLKRLITKMQLGERGFGDYLFKETVKYMVFTPCRMKHWSVGITLHRSELMAEIYKLRRRMITFSSMIIGLILFVSFMFVKSITHPISQLINGARAIGGGDLDQIIKIESNDELHGLAREFNKMAAKLKGSVQEIIELKTFNDDIFRSVTSGIITVNREIEFTSLNRSAEKIVGHTWEEINTIGIRDVPANINEIFHLLKDTLENKEKIQNHKIEIPREEGEVVFVEVNTSLLNDSSGIIIGAIADVRDITKRKRMEDLMIRVDKLASLGELSAGIAHEIRNPLAGMKTSSQVLAKKLTSTSEKVLIDGVLSEIARLNKIVTDLLNFSRPSSPLFTSVEIPFILEKTIDLVHERIKKSNIKLIRRYDQNLPHVIIDMEQIKQVFLNLLLNAIKAMPETGTLTISIKAIIDQSKIKDKILVPCKIDFSKEKEYIEVSFKDTGCGIKEKNLGRIFNPFFTTDHNGTGLGLPIVHKLLEKNNGYIYIDSKYGKGSNVTLLLPAEEISARVL